MRGVVPFRDRVAGDHKSLTSALHGAFVLAKVARRPYESGSDQQDASIQSWM
jgi:hypothetical protein